MFECLQVPPTFGVNLGPSGAEKVGGDDGPADDSSRWAAERAQIERLLEDGTEGSTLQALQALARAVDALEDSAPALQGAHDAHAFACDRLEALVLDAAGALAPGLAAAAAYLYGRALALSPLTEEAVALAIDHLLRGNSAHSTRLVLAVLVGVEQSNAMLFEDHIAVLVSQIEAGALTADDELAREAMLRAIRLYARSERADTCRLVLTTTHAMLHAALDACRDTGGDGARREMGVAWVCFTIAQVPLTLRTDLTKNHAACADPRALFDVLAAAFDTARPETQAALVGALPVLATYETPEFVRGPESQMHRAVAWMMRLGAGAPRLAMQGLEQLAGVVLDKFTPFAVDVGNLALEHLRNPRSRHQAQAQRLLSALLAAVGPAVLGVMIEYLRAPARVLLADTRLLVQIVTLLPNLTPRITGVLVDVVQRIIHDGDDRDEQLAVLAALAVFPLDDQELADAAQSLVMWSVDEDRGRDVVVAALQVATIPNISTASSMRSLTYKTAQLLLADDAHIVHVALSVLSNPALADAVDEKACGLILLALHKSLEPSIQVVAARLLTHLATAHRAIVQPLAWSHIRQSLSLMDFLRTVDPTRASVEACIISNLLPALPTPLHQKYAGPVKDLILAGLRAPAPASSPASLPLIFQGLANLARFEGWPPAQQARLALDVLELARDLPRDAQHAALGAVARLSAGPQSSADAYDLLLNLHSMFGGNVRLDPELKALVSAVYGHLGTVERNPIVSRDSRAAIQREMAVYPPHTVTQSEVAEVRYRHGAGSSAHVHALVAKTLADTARAEGPFRKSADDRALVLEATAAFGILQPRAVAALVPDLPAAILKDVHRALEGALAPGVPISVMLLAAVLHVSPGWLAHYWAETADVLSECVKAGDGLAVLKALDVILDAVKV
ncbi:hypothetical protein Q5752_006087 [Cryptotrichosporon argae]